MNRIITTDDLTGRVISEWCGGVDQALEPVAGRTHRPVPDDGKGYDGQRWTGVAFEAIPSPPPVTPDDAATAEARRKDIIATCALMVMQRDRTAWNAMTSAQRLDAVRQQVDLWKGLRVFLDDKTL